MFFKFVFEKIRVNKVNLFPSWVIFLILGLQGRTVDALAVFLCNLLSSLIVNNFSPRKINPGCVKIYRRQFFRKLLCECSWRGIAHPRINHDDYSR